jgi:hypothetical protein
VQGSDDLARTLKKSVSEILTIISALELEGVIEKNEAGCYQIKV